MDGPGKEKGPHPEDWSKKRLQSHNGQVEGAWQLFKRELFGKEVKHSGREEGKVRNGSQVKKLSIDR